MLAFSAISLLVVLQTASASPLLEKDIIARQAPAAVSLAKTSNYLELTSNPASNVVASSRAVSKYGSAKLRATLYSQIWSAKVKVGGETVLLILDTGSSDTFLIHKGYQCVDSDGVIQSQETCAAPAYNGVTLYRNPASRIRLITVIQAVSSKVLSKVYVQKSLLHT